MTEPIMALLSWLNEWFFSPISALVLLFAGIILSVKLKFFQFSNPAKLFRLMCEKKNGDGNSPFRALTLALAGTLGVGNISGVALALAYGGAGAIFWMWVSAACAMIVKYSEIVLAVYHRDVKNGEIHGGAMYYIKKGVKKHGAASLLASGFAVFCLFSSLSTGSIIQANAVSEAFSGCFNMPPFIVGIIMAALTAIAVFGSNAKKISDITVKLVPFMSLIYIALSMFVIMSNASSLPQILHTIVEDAFRADSAIGGIGGFIFSSSVRYGVTRGLFSNEAGCGTSTIAHASANTSSPSSQGVWGIFEVFVDTVLLCTITAFVLLINYGGSVPAEGGGVMVTLYAFGSSLGAFAKDILAFSVFLFAYATVICWAYYGCECIHFLHDSKIAKNVYLSIFTLSVIYGAVAPSSFIWTVADSCICIMMTVNTVCVCLMSDTVLKLSKDKISAKSKKRTALSLSHRN